MALNPGSRIGPYEIVGAIGAGGMGEVYRARDAKLGREVALKILPDAFAADPDRLARFEREARTLAALNHPHIAQIYGFEERDGTCALVMELVEGEDLDARLAHGPIPLHEALVIAKQMADGLEAAHQIGIVHRDLKPANVKLRPDGTLKILDFGLAKPGATGMSRHGTASDPLNSPTITSRASLTMQGMILGTAAYMSPEQAKGRPADQQSDIWAFGCVLFEMLTGSRAFGGQDVHDHLAAILRSEPAWDRLPVGTPPALQVLLRRCLEKDPRRRLRHIGDAALDLDEASHQDGANARFAGDRTATRRGGRWAWSAAMAIALAVVAGSAYWLAARAAPPAPPEMRLELATPPSADPVSFALAPDGRSLVSVDTADGRARLVLRSLETGDVRGLPGTDGAFMPFWSPDGQTIAFFADDGRLKSVGVQGGLVHTLAGAPLPRGGAWSRDNVIVYAPSTGPIFRMVANGAPVPLTQIRAGHNAHAFPSFLPDDRRFLYFVSGLPNVRGVYVGDVDGGDGRRVLEADSSALYVASGHVLFVRGETLFAQRFDPVALTVIGDPVRLAEAITHHGLAPAETWAVSASATGTIAYRSGPAYRGRQFVWVDRAGKTVAAIGDPDLAQPLSGTLSPDGRRLAIHRAVGGNVDIWILELGRGGLTKFTTDVSNEVHATWSPDGARILFNSNRSGGYLLYQKLIAGGDETEIKVPGVDLAGSISDWSPDGRLLLYNRRDRVTGTDVWAVPLAGDGKPSVIVQTESEDRDAQFSPDGRWIAYQSDESGRAEVYVQPFPGPGLKSRISRDGGAQPRWRRDGKELFYVALDERLMSVPLALTSGADRFEAGAATPLFRVRVGGALQSASRHQYFVAADGQRFLLNTVIESESRPLSLILNWRPSQ